jgi:hypothetical protein
VIPVAVGSKVWVCGRLLRFGFESRRGHECLSVGSVVSFQVEVSVRCDHSSRGVLQNVVCLSVIMKLRQPGGLGPIGLSSRLKKTDTLRSSVFSYRQERAWQYNQSKVDRSTGNMVKGRNTLCHSTFA